VRFLSCASSGQRFFDVPEAKTTELFCLLIQWLGGNHHRKIDLHIDFSPDNTMGPAGTETCTSTEKRNEGEHPVRGASFNLAPAPGSQNNSGRIAVEEIAARLNLGRLTVYTMLERGIIPSIRLGRRWIITRQAYEHWERTCGMSFGAGLPAGPEVTVLN
jgi:excisionase family DNA binding protein